MSYLLLLVAAFLAELASLVLVGSYVGWMWTFGLLAISVVIGVALVSGRGPATLRDVGRAMLEGRSPGPAIVDGALLAIAGILFITPGFASDLIGLALLLPPVRAGIRKRSKVWLVARWKARHPGEEPDDDAGYEDGVIDVSAEERPAARGGRGPSLPS